MADTLLEVMHSDFASVFYSYLSAEEGATILDLVTLGMEVAVSTDAALTTALVELAQAPTSDARRRLRGAQVAHLFALSSVIHVVGTTTMLTAPLVEHIVEVPLMEPLILPDVAPMLPLADEEVDTARVWRDTHTRSLAVFGGRRGGRYHTPTHTHTHTQTHTACV